MVMATPSPQQVGREFVRQYYTVLHEAPHVLHRFYNSGSTFVHGGVDRPGLTVEEPVIGQLEIDKKIKLLNFKDCHTKIRQVDSQSTIGNGVVVQVTGELSNNGEPMRRFMQTFVLAPQTPKKFYVHNDIFRYQDEVYQDVSDTESEDHQTSEVSSSAANKSSSYYHHQQNDTDNDQSEIVVTASVEQSNIEVAQQTQPQQQDMLVNESIVKSEQQNLLNGHLHTSTSSSASTIENNEEKVHLQQQQPKQTHDVDVKENVNEFNDATVTQTSNVSAVENKEDIGKPAQDSNSSDSKNSWAQIINKGGENLLTVSGTAYPSGNAGTMGNNNNSNNVFGTSNSNPTNQQNNFNKSSNKPQVQISTNQNGQPNSSLSSASSSSKNQKPVNRTSNINNNNNNNSNNNSNANQPQQSPASGGTNRGMATGTNNVNVNNNANANVNALTSGVNQMDLDDEKRFNTRYHDNQQVFVGNLSQELSDAELKQFFGTFGKVLEVRINTNTKQQSGRRLPNYGFVVFEDKQTVDNLLGSSKSNNLTYKNEKGEFRLNVEEKRARQGRITTGFNGGSKVNRATRSSSNGSRNGGNQPNGNSKRSNYESNYNNNNGDREGYNKRKSEIPSGGHHGDSVVDNSGQTYRSNKNTNTFRRS